MKPIQAMTSAFKNFANFSGRTGRGDYWWYVLAYILGLVLFGILGKVLSGSGTAELRGGDGFGFSYSAGTLGAIWFFANIVPAIAIGVRRLQDTNRPGWMYLLALVPLVNFYLLYLLTTKGTAGENRFGPDPLG